MKSKMSEERNAYQFMTVIKGKKAFIRNHFCVIVQVDYFSAKFSLCALTVFECKSDLTAPV